MLPRRTTHLVFTLAGCGVTTLLLVLLARTGSPALVAAAGRVLVPLGAGLLLLACLCQATARRDPVRRLQDALGDALLVVLLGALAFEAWAWSRRPPVSEEVLVVDALSGINMPHRELGWIGRPGFASTGEVLDARLGTLTIEYRNNSKGFRDIEQARDDRPAIVFVGDSLAWGHGLAFTDMAVQHLRTLLPQAQVFNLACQAYSTDQFLRTYELFGRELRPKVVVAMSLFVPLAQRSVPLGWGLRKPWYRLEGEQLVLAGVPIEHPADAAERQRLLLTARAAGIHDLGSAWEYLVRDCLGKGTHLGQRVLATWDEARRVTAGPPLPTPVVFAIHRRMRDLARADGASYVFATTPEISYFKSKDPVQTFAGEVRAFATRGIDVFDFTPLFVDPGAAGAGARLYERDKHPGPEGQRKMAEALAAKLRPLLGR